MKSIVKISVVLMILFLVVSACVLDQISVGWAIGTLQVNGDKVLGIPYNIWNDGKYDLRGVNLTFAVTSPAGTLFVKTPDFNLDRKEEIDNNVLLVNVSPDDDTQVTFVEVVGVDMDKPND